jgi:hypothetical protein
MCDKVNRHLSPIHVKLRKSHDRTWKFKIEWATKLPSVEDLVAKGGFIHTMKCKVCSFIENKEKIGVASGIL